MKLHFSKRKKSIFRKTAAVFIIVALIPISILELRSYQTYAGELKSLVDTKVITEEKKASLLRETKVHSLVYTSYGLVVALVLGYFFAAGVVRPIRTLQEGARRIGAGDFDFRVKTDTEDELEELAITINNMAGSLQAREAEINRRSRDLQLLYEIAHTLAESRDLNKLLGFALEKALAVTGSAMGCVLLVSDSGELQPVVCQVLNGNQAVAAAIFNEAAAIATTGKPVVFDYISSPDDTFDAIACVPLLFGEKLQGALCLAVTKDEFTNEALELLSAIGNEVAVAIENARLFKEMKARNAELAKATAEIADLISEAEIHQSFGIRFQNKNLVKCWEYNQCNYKQCPAYESENLRCWQVAGTHCRGEVQGVFAQKLGRCEKCKVFKAACPDKITLLGETFNNMMVVLEQKVQEQEELQRRLYNTSKLAAIGELAAGVAHEINNPLTGILGSALLMKSKLAADEESKKRLNVIESEALRARDIVRNLLDFAHQGNSLRPVLTPVRDLLQQTLFLVRHQTDLSKIKIAVNIDDNLPAVAVDPNQMKQVFMNIIHNAIQSMRGGGQLDIYAHISKENNQQPMLQIDFTDTGIGIDEQALSRIFDPFFTTKQVGEGTGLGLSLSQRIVSEHGGEIKARSKPGKGSTFTVSLPLTKETDTPRLGEPSGQQVA